MWKPSLLSSLPFLPFGMAVSILCLSHHCIFEAYNFGDFLQKLFRKFPGSLVVRILGFLCHGPGSISAQELRSYKPHDVAKPVGGKKKLTTL